MSCPRESHLIVGADISIDILKSRSSKLHSFGPLTNLAYSREGIEFSIFSAKMDFYASVQE